MHVNPCWLFFFFLRSFIHRMLGEPVSEASIFNAWNKLELGLKWWKMSHELSHEIMNAGNHYVRYLAVSQVRSLSNGLTYFVDGHRFRMKRNSMNFTSECWVHGSFFQIASKTIFMHHSFDSMQIAIASNFLIDDCFFYVTNREKTHKCCCSSGRWHVSF